MKSESTFWPRIRISQTKMQSEGAKCLSILNTYLYSQWINEHVSSLDRVRQHVKNEWLT